LQGLAAVIFSLRAYIKAIVPMVARVLQGRSLTDPLRETVAHKTSRPAASRPGRKPGGSTVMDKGESNIVSLLRAQRARALAKRLEQEKREHELKSSKIKKRGVKPKKKQPIRDDWPFSWNGRIRVGNEINKEINRLASERGLESKVGIDIKELSKYSSEITDAACKAAEAIYKRTHIEGRLQKFYVPAPKKT
jgi:hypothetical protein